jgi:hypothetical protein
MVVDALHVGCLAYVEWQCLLISSHIRLGPVQADARVGELGLVHTLDKVVNRASWQLWGFEKLV